MHWALFTFWNRTIPIHCILGWVWASFTQHTKDTHPLAEKIWQKHSPCSGIFKPYHKECSRFHLEKARGTWSFLEAHINISQHYFPANNSKLHCPEKYISWTYAFPEGCWGDTEEIFPVELPKWGSQNKQFSSEHAESLGQSAISFKCSTRWFIRKDSKEKKKDEQLSCQENQQREKRNRTYSKRKKAQLLSFKERKKSKT